MQRRSFVEIRAESQKSRWERWLIIEREAYSKVASSSLWLTNDKKFIVAQIDHGWRPASRFLHWQGHVIHCNRDPFNVDLTQGRHTQRASESQAGGVLRLVQWSKRVTTSTR